MQNCEQNCKHFDLSRSLLCTDNNLNLDIFPADILRRVVFKNIVLFVLGFWHILTRETCSIISLSKFSGQGMESSVEQFSALPTACDAINIKNISCYHVAGYVNPIKRVYSDK